MRSNWRCTTDSRVCSRWRRKNLRWMMSGDRSNKKEWISKEIWETTEQRKEAKNAVNMARTRNQRRDASRRHQELNREVKRSCRRNKRVYVESMAERAEEAGRRDDVKTLHEITRRLSGRFRSTCKPERNETGVLLRTEGLEDAQVGGAL